MSDAGRYDVIVAGAGPAGAAAAVSAARCGARVAVVERDHFPGGTPASAMVTPMQAFGSPAGRIIGGFGQELVVRLVRAGGSLGHLVDPVGFCNTVTPVDAGALRVELFRMFSEAGVEFIGGTRVEGVETGAGGVITGVAVRGEMGESGVLRAGAFVDATGNGDLAAAAGAPFEVDENCQPMTLIFKVGGVDTARIIAFQKERPEEFVMHPDPAVLGSGYVGVSGFFSAVARAREAGRLNVPRDRLLLFGGVNRGEIVVNTTRVQGYSGLSAPDVAAATRLGYLQAAEVFRFLREDIPGFENAALLEMAPRIGVRETRRIAGRFRIEEKHLLETASFPDVVAKGSFPVDIHLADSAGIESAAIPGKGHYDIPLGCLLPERISNLLVAGRCMSASHRAFASTRVQPTSMALGQAAGVAASLAAREPGGDIAESITKIQDILIQQGAILSDDAIVRDY